MIWVLISILLGAVCNIQVAWQARGLLVFADIHPIYIPIFWLPWYDAK